MLRKVSAWVVLGLFAGLGAQGMSANSVHADENMGEKVENKADEMTKDTKSTVRKGKRKARNATGHGSTTEDVKDASKDAGDEISHGAKKVKNKVD